MSKPLANIGGVPPQLPVEDQIRRLTRRSFAGGAAAALAGAAGVGWIGTRPEEDGVPWPLRRVLEFNESIAQRFFQRSAAGSRVSCCVGGVASRKRTCRFDDSRMARRLGSCTSWARPIAIFRSVQSKSCQLTK